VGAGPVAQAPGRRLAGPATRSGDARVDRAGLDGVSEAAEAQDAGGGRVSLGAAHRARVRASRNRLDHRGSGRYVGGWSRRGRALDFDGESLPVDPAVAIGVRCCRRADPSERGGSRDVAIWWARAPRGRVLDARGARRLLYVDSLKGRRSRTVPLPPAVVPIVDRWSAAQNLDDWLCSSPEGTCGSAPAPLSESNWKRSIRWSDACEATGRQLRPHDLRHMAASIWLGGSAGVRPRVSGADSGSLRAP